MEELDEQILNGLKNPMVILGLIYGFARDEIEKCPYCNNLNEWKIEDYNEKNN